MSAPRLAGIALPLALALAGCHGAAEQSPAPADSPPLRQLRMAVVQPGTGCASDAPGWPAGERAYVRHLSERMEIPVQICAVGSRAEAARAVNDRRAELALLDPASYAPYRAALRPILTPRLPVDLGRVEVVLAVSEASPIKALADADQGTLVFAGPAAPQLDGPRQTLASAGLPPARLAAARVVAGPGAVASQIRAAPDAVGAFLSADWSRLCRGMARDDHPCQGLRQVWRGRRQAATAWVVRRDIPRESWARLVGIHVALFQEQPAIARWLAPGTTEIEPTEAGALDPIRGPR